MEGLPGLIGIGVVAVVGFLMARSFGNGRKDQRSSSDNGAGYEGPGVSSTSAWFGGLFGASLGASSSQEGGGSSDNTDNSSSDTGGGSDGGGGGGGDGGGGGGD
jgi:hypothetical protein